MLRLSTCGNKSGEQISEAFLFTLFSYFSPKKLMVTLMLTSMLLGTKQGYSFLPLSRSNFFFKSLSNFFWLSEEILASFGALFSLFSILFLVRGEIFSKIGYFRTLTFPSRIWVSEELLLICWITLANPFISWVWLYPMIFIVSSMYWAT